MYMYVKFLIVMNCFILLQLNKAVDTLLDALKDPSLPLLEIQVCVVQDVVLCNTLVILFIVYCDSL